MCSRISASTFGRPARLPCCENIFQCRRNRRRCQSRTVSGFTIRSRLVQLAHVLRSAIQNARSASCSLGLCFPSFSAVTCCRRARFSRSRSPLDLQAARSRRTSRVSKNMNACHIVGGEWPQRAVIATASPLPRATLGSPAPESQHPCKYLIYKADGIMKSQNHCWRSQRGEESVHVTAGVEKQADDVPVSDAAWVTVLGTFALPLVGLLVTVSRDAAVHSSGWAISIQSSQRAM